MHSQLIQDLQLLFLKQEGVLGFISATLMKPFYDLISHFNYRDDLQRGVQAIICLTMGKIFKYRFATSDFLNMFHTLAHNISVHQKIFDFSASSMTGKRKVLYWNGLGNLGELILRLR